MKRAGTWLRRLLILTVLLVVAAVVVYVTLGAALARRIVVARLEAMGMNVTRITAGRPGLGTLRLADLELGPDAWLTAASLTVTYDLAGLLGGRLDIDVDSLTARLAHGGGTYEAGLNGVLRRSGDASWLVDLAGSVGGGAGDWRVGARVDLQGRLSPVGDGSDSQLELHVADGSVTNHTRRIELGGIAGTLSLSGLRPPVTAAPQRLVLGAGKIGKLPISRGVADVALLEGGELSVERLEWTMAEYGEFRADPFRVSPARPAVNTRISATAIALGPWLALLTEGRVRAEGSLRGDLEVGYDPARPDRPVAFGAGSLEASPATGWVRFGDDRELRDLLEAGDPRFRDPEFRETVGDRIVAALSDFAFTQLRLAFIRADGQTLVRITIAGAGRRGAEPVEIGSLTLNIRGFEEFLYLAASLRKGL